jgi:hypothetical protein
VTFGAPFFPGGACPEGEGAGVSAGVGDGVSSAVGVGDAVAFLRFDLLFGVAVGDGVGEIFFFFGEAVGDEVGEAFCPACFRCLRDGLGVGVGSKTFLIFVANDSSAGCAAQSAPNSIAKIKSHFITEACHFNAVASAVLSGESSVRSESDALRQRTLQLAICIGRQDARRPHRQDVCATSVRAPEGLLC